jgi:hypothetical protein
MMDEPQPPASLISALTTEHFVLQTAASSTIAEAGARSSLYVFSLSSSLVALGFTAHSREVFIPFAAGVLPALFLMGIFTVVRLVDTTLENMQYLAGIARVRSYYRTLAPDGAIYFAARHGRWPELQSDPSLQHGVFIAFFGTTATMVALINSIVAGAGVAMFVAVRLGADRLAVAVGCGVVCAVTLIGVFVVYQRWRIAGVDLGEPTWASGA